MTNSKTSADAKLAAYIGFSIKAGKAIFGADNIYKTSPRVVLIDKTLADNTLKKLQARCQVLSIPLITLTGLGDLISKPSCKAVGIKEPNLAKAIITATNTVFEGE